MPLDAPTTHSKTVIGVQSATILIPVFFTTFHTEYSLNKIHWLGWFIAIQTIKQLSCNCKQQVQGTE